MAGPPPGRAGSLSSISFIPNPEAEEHKKQADKPRRSSARAASPPAPSKFESHVSFDNFGGGEPTEHNAIAFTLNEKHMGYQYKRRSRTFMVGIDENAYSDYALQWMLDEMVDDGDEIVCLRVVEKDSKMTGDKSLLEKHYQQEAKKLMKDIQAKNDTHRAISIVVELAVGKLHATFQKMIQLYEPGMLIVGTRGRSLGGVQGLINNRNSFSKWCLQYSPIPVVVVRPTEKRDKKKTKRANDPARGKYAQMLQDSGVGVHEANILPKHTGIETPTLPPNAPEIEAHEVAAALGLPSKFDPTIKHEDLDARLRAAKAKLRERDLADEFLGRPSNSRPTTPEQHIDIRESSVDSPAISDDEESDDEEADFEVTSGHDLLENEPDALEKQQKLHAMEQGEAAALAAGRKGSVASIDSNNSTTGNDHE